MDKKLLRDMLLILLGTALISAAAKYVYLPASLDTGGISGVAVILDCLWGELYGSINMAEISDGCITPEHADYLRKKYLFGGSV